MTRKVRVKGHQLTDVDVAFISLVERPANRTPFRVTKQEDSTMIDLSKISLFKREPKKPTLSAIIVKAASLAAVMDRLTKSDFDLSKKIEVGEAVIFLQGKLDADKVVKSDTLDFGGETALFQLDDSICFAITGDNVKKMVDSAYSSTSFNEVLALEGVYPMISTAMSALHSTVCNILHGTESRDEAKSAVTKATSDAGSYITAVLDMLPASVLKMDPAAVPVAKTEAKADDTKSEAEPAKEETKVEAAATVDASAPAETVTKTETEAPAKDEPAKEEPKVENSPEPAVVAKSDSDKTLEALTALTSLVTGLSTTVQTIVAGQASLDEKITKAATAAEDAGKVAKAATDAVGAVKATLNKTVPGVTDTRPEPEKSHTAKTEQGNMPEDFVLLDTAFQDPRRAYGVN